MYYIVKHNDELIRMNSRSGGVFTAITDYILENRGVIYGCILNEEYKAIHIRASSKRERDRMRGSKYVQSDLQNIFELVKKDILDGKEVLFSGTSCQVYAIKKYLEKYDCSKFYTTDIVCHGVPSPSLWEAYLKYCEKKYNGKIEAFEFRNKIRYGWKSHIETFTIKNKEYSSEIYTDMFYSHNILRECCFHCPFKSTIHNSDITIADAWGVDECDKDFNDDKGVSFVFPNSNIGEEILSKALVHCSYKIVDLANYLQRPLVSPFRQPEGYHHFWNNYITKGYYPVFSEISRKVFYKKIKIQIKKRLLYIMRLRMIEQ